MQHARGVAQEMKMKRLLEFNEEDDQEFYWATNGKLYYLALFDIDQKLREQIKYNDDLSDSAHTALSDMREELHTIIKDYNLEI